MPAHRPLAAGHAARWTLAAACLATGGLAGCVEVPRLVPDLDLRAAQQPTRIEGARGPLSAARQRQLLERLKAEPGQPSSILERHLAVEQALTDSPLVADNQVTLLQDGEATYRAMFAAIAAAKRSILMETYILEYDEVGQRFADALIAKRRQGLQVNLMYDSVGSIGTPDEFFERLRAEGIAVVEYNPVNPLDAKGGWDVNGRNHRKLMVVDGAVAFLGGINISGVYSGGSAGSGSGGKAKRRSPEERAKEATERPWRDTHVRIEGPVAVQFLQGFARAWASQKGPVLNAADLTLPAPAVRGRHVVRAIDSAPDDPYSAIYTTLMSSIDHAEKEVWITNAYFVPDPQLLDALCRAAQRGVDVRMILPRHSDAPIVVSAGRSHYGTLLKAGVKLYERRSVLLHSKTAVIDGVWSTVGSTNLDWRSFVHNRELNAAILGDEFGGEMRRVFERDQAMSDPVTLEAWQARPIKQRLTEWLGRVLQYWL